MNELLIPLSNNLFKISDSCIEVIKSVSQQRCENRSVLHRDKGHDDMILQFVFISRRSFFTFLNGFDSILA